MMLRLAIPCSRGPLLFGLLLPGTLYGDPDPGDARLYLRKYLDLLLIPVFGCAFSRASREQGGRMLACGLALVLLMSCG